MNARVISFHYTLKNNKGDVLDSSVDGEPMTILEGAGQIIPGLETTLRLLSPGDKRDVTVKAADAYGEYDENLKIDVPVEQFPKNHNLKVGDMFRAGRSESESQVFQVMTISESHIGLDGNHPLAGQDLFFSVELTSARPATDEEMAHGHAHGPDGHGHGHLH